MCVSVTTLVSVEKPLEVRSWVREYLKQAVRQVWFFFLKMKMKILIQARKKNGGRKMLKRYKKRKKQKRKDEIPNPLLPLIVS